MCRIPLDILSVLHLEPCESCIAVVLPCPLHLGNMREASTHAFSPCNHAGDPFCAISHPLIVMLLAQRFYIRKKGCISIAQCIPALLESVLCPVGFMDKVIVASVQQRDTLTEIEEPVSTLCKIWGAAFYCHATLL